VIRKAKPADVPRLVALMAEFYAEGGYGLNQQRATQAFTALLADERLGQAWLIQLESEDAGHVVVTLCFSMEYGATIAFVDDLFVRKRFRRAGLAKAALTEVRAFCTSRGVRAIFVETGPENVAAQAAYRQAGFADTKRSLLALTLDAPTHVG
jgi:GNAT superfamily N-acetyltransferase